MISDFIQMVENYTNSTVPDRVVNKAERMFTSRIIVKGEMLIHVGDIQNELYIVLSGLMRSYYIDINGNDVTRFFPRRGTLCGEILFSDGPSNHCTQALEDCEILVISVDDFKSLVEEEIYCTKAHLKALEESFKYKIERESSFLLKSATERYIDFKKMYPELEERVNQRHIASYLGITPVSLSRIKGSLREQV
jgi:CRP-like cAMP-binding protein